MERKVKFTGIKTSHKIVWNLVLDQFDDRQDRYYPRDSEISDECLEEKGNSL